MATISFNKATIKKAGDGFVQVAPQVEALGTKTQSIREGELSGQFWDDKAKDKYVQVSMKHEKTLQQAKKTLDDVGKALLEIAAKMQETSDNMPSIVR